MTVKTVYPQAEWGADQLQNGLHYSSRTALHVDLRPTGIPICGAYISRKERVHKNTEKHAHAEHGMPQQLTSLALTLAKCPAKRAIERALSLKGLVPKPSTREIRPGSQRWGIAT
jgi:hypothetical protein